MQTVNVHSRMDAVQAPIIPVIGRMIRETPGTISLGQGVVHFGPPREAIDAAADALGDMVTHEYGDGAGSAALVAKIAEKLRRDNGIDVGSHPTCPRRTGKTSGPGSRRWSPRR